MTALPDGLGQAAGTSRAGGGSTWQWLRARAGFAAIAIVAFSAWHLGWALEGNTYHDWITGIRPVMLMLLLTCILCVGWVALNPRIDGRDLALLCLIALLVEGSGLFSVAIPPLILSVYNWIIGYETRGFPGFQFIPRYVLFLTAIVIVARHVVVGGSSRTLDRVIMLLGSVVMIVTMLVFHLLLIEVGLFHEKRARLRMMESVIQVENGAERQKLCGSIGLICVEGSRSDPRAAFEPLRPLYPAPFFNGFAWKSVWVLENPYGGGGAKGYTPSYDLSFMSPWQEDFAQVEDAPDVDEVEYLGLVWRDGARYRAIIDTRWQRQNERQQVALSVLVCASHLIWGFGAVLLIGWHRRGRSGIANFRQKAAAQPA